MSLAVVFDLDDTLYPESSYNLSGFQAVGRHVAERYGATGFDGRCRELFLRGARGHIFDEALGEAGLQVPVAELVEVYRNHTPRLELHEDARSALDLLRGKVPLGLLTDGPAAVQRRKVAALGLAEVFDVLVFSDDEGPRAWKPSPRPYRRVMEALGDRAGGFLYVGDNPRKDFVTARELGWRTIRIERPGQVHPPGDVQPGQDADRTVTSLMTIPWSEFFT